MAESTGGAALSWAKAGQSRLKQTTLGCSQGQGCAASAAESCGRRSAGAYTCNLGQPRVGAMQNLWSRRMQRPSPHKSGGEAHAAAPCPNPHLDSSQAPCQQGAELVLACRAQGVGMGGWGRGWGPWG